MGDARQLVIYHAACYDGFTAAWVAQKHFPGIELFPATYGDDPPDVTGRDVYIVDFSYKREQMLTMNEQAQGLVVLDHHKTAEAECAGLDFCLFDMNRSGAGMAWDYFFGEPSRPWLVDAIEDRDLWRFALPTTKSIHAYVSSLDMTLANWDVLAEYNQAVVLECGVAIERSIHQYCKKVAEASARSVSLWGLTAVVATAPYINCSELAHYLLETHNPLADLSLTYYQNNVGEWVYSLRARKGDGVDVSEIAKTHGGGGHELAAGFKLPHLLTTLVSEALP